MNEPKRHPSESPQMEVLYTNIGRGHPFYLDGIVQSLVRLGAVGLVRGENDVFSQSHGTALWAWSMARWMYRHGSSGGLGPLYARLRAGIDYGRPSLLQKVMGRDIVTYYSDRQEPLLVAHPSLVGILGRRPGLFYQHGELVAPSEALVRGATKVLVPTSDVADKFIAVGYQPDQIMISGLCIDPGLVRQAGEAFQRRKQRYQNSEPLTGAFFSSGAEPTKHIHKIIRTALSVVSEGGRAIIFGTGRGRLIKKVNAALGTARLEALNIDRADVIPMSPPPVLLVSSHSRREMDILTARLFERFDYLVAPAHERTNWAVGLGLPMFVIGPHVGSYAPANAALLEHLGAGEELPGGEDVELFGSLLERLRVSGKLGEMADRGWGPDIGGFSQIAKFFINMLSLTV